MSATTKALVAFLAVGLASMFGASWLDEGLRQAVTTVLWMVAGLCGFGFLFCGIRFLVTWLDGGSGARPVSSASRATGRSVSAPGAEHELR